MQTTLPKDVCEIHCVDHARIATAKKRMHETATIEALAETFKVLSEPTRVRILQALSEEELCVCDIAAVVEMTSSAVSHQLRILRAAGLIKSRKAGKLVYCTLDDEHVRNLFEEGIRHVKEG